jgi:tetratricopeptide (TPR) repeat protein
MSEQLHDSLRMVVALGNLALFDDVAGQWQAASASYLRAIELSARLGATTQCVRHTQNLGLLSINIGDDKAAFASLTNALELARANNLREYELVCQFGLADLHLRRDEIDAAVPLLEKVEQLAVITGSRNRQQEVYRYWAYIHLMRGDAVEGLATVERALALGREIGDLYDEGLSLRIQGLALLALGRPGDAHVAFERSLMLLADDPYESARTQVHWGLALRDSGDAGRGTAMLHEARANFAYLGARRDLAEVNRWLVG